MYISLVVNLGSEVWVADRGADVGGGLVGGP